MDVAVRRPGSIRLFVPGGGGVSSLAGRRRPRPRLPAISESQVSAAALWARSLSNVRLIQQLTLGPQK